MVSPAERWRRSPESELRALGERVPERASWWDVFNALVRLLSGLRGRRGDDDAEVYHDSAIFGDRLATLGGF